MKTTLTFFLVLLTTVLTAQDSVSTTQQNVVESQLSIKQFVSHQKSATSKYVIGGGMYVSAGLIQSTNPESAVPTSVLTIIGSIFCISAWIEDRRSYRHLEDAADYMLQSLE